MLHVFDCFEVVLGSVGVVLRLPSRNLNRRRQSSLRFFDSLGFLNVL